MVMGIVKMTRIGLTKILAREIDTPLKAHIHSDRHEPRQEDKL